jgi:hypothetical protein
MADSYPLATRFNLPPEVTGELQNIPLELLPWSLYSSAAFANGTAIPRQTQLFNYIRGSTVSGAGSGAIAATRWHTNMEAIQTLPAPKTFLCTTLRVNILPVAVTTTTALADDTVGTAEENNDQVDDLLAFMFSTALRFKIGESTYVEHPLWMFPTNNGIGGLAACSVHANGSVIWQTRVAAHTRGVAYDFGDAATARRPVLWNQQSFTVDILGEFATMPSPADDKIVQVVLDGVMGRELQ